MAGVPAAVSAAIASAAVLPRLAGSASQATTSGEVSREAGDRRQRAQYVGRGDRAAERQHRRPGEPVAPHRQRRDELGIAQPCRRAIDRGAARLRREQAGDLGVGEGLDQAEDHRGDPDGEGEIAGGAGDAADREKHQRRHAAGNPEGAAPVDGSVQLAACRHSSIRGDRVHDDVPSQGALVGAGSLAFPGGGTVPIAPRDEGDFPLSFLFFLPVKRVTQPLAASRACGWSSTGLSRPIRIRLRAGAFAAMENAMTKLSNKNLWWWAS